MTQQTKLNADQEAICQALEQLEQSMDIIHQIVKRLQRSVRLAQAKSLHDVEPPKANNAASLPENDERFQHTGNRRTNEPSTEIDEKKLNKTLH